MIEEPTCLILGAGASAPYGLPTAMQLRDLIIPSRSPTGLATATKFPIKTPQQAWLDGVQPVKEWTIYLQQAAERAGVTTKLTDFWNKFYLVDQTIDWFIRDNEDQFGDIARLHIAAVLLNCERDNLSGNWYRSLATHLFAGGPQNLEDGKLSVISFNYDRSLERYLLNVLENQYGLSWADAKELLSRVRIEHVYGQLGTLDEVPYGDFMNAPTAAKGIRLIRPQPDPAVKEKINAMVARSTYVNFIGFGFDDDNINLLGPDNIKGKNKRPLSTSRGLNPVTRRKASQNFGVRFGNEPDLDAEQFFGARDVFGPKRATASTGSRRPAPRRPSPQRPRSSWMGDLGTGWKI